MRAASLISLASKVGDQWNLCSKPYTISISPAWGVAKLPWVLDELAMLRPRPLASIDDGERSGRSNRAASQDLTTQITLSTVCRL